MSVLTIRKLDDEVKQRLRMRAARHGTSMEAEARAILEQAVRIVDEPLPMDQALKSVRGRWKDRVSTEEVMRITRTD